MMRAEYMPTESMIYHLEKDIKKLRVKRILAGSESKKAEFSKMIREKERTIERIKNRGYANIDRR